MTRSGDRETAATKSGVRVAFEQVMCLFHQLGTFLILAFIRCYSSANFSQGCNGGNMDSAFNFTKLNGGIMAEEAYPYVDSDGKCQAPSNFTAAVTLTGWE
jgi:hypothetical protein